MAYHQGGLSSGQFVIRMVCHPDCFSSGQLVNRMVCHQDGLSSGQSVIRMAYHQGGLSSGWSQCHLYAPQWLAGPPITRGVRLKAHDAPPPPPPNRPPSPKPPSQVPTTFCISPQIYRYANDKKNRIPEEACCLIKIPFHSAGYSQAKALRVLIHLQMHKREEWKTPERRMHTKVCLFYFVFIVNLHELTLSTMVLTVLTSLWSVAWVN